MAGRRLSAEEAALWQRVIASVRPAAPRAPAAVPAAPEPVPLVKPPRSPRVAPPPAPPRAKPASPMPGTTLDGQWDRKLAGGRIDPDTTVDLHGHTLDTAYARLDTALADAIARGDRVLLLVTGRPPRPESERPHARGRIRAAVGDWIAASRHAARIAAVRPAHPRHGGAGALYIILRRPRRHPNN